MLILALDCSTRTGSIALARDGVVLESRAGEAAVRHAVRLPGDLIALLGAHGCALGDVDLFAAAAGPGGFTGLRVGLATVQGLAMALDRRVFLASTLDLLAVAGTAAAPETPWVGAWMLGMRGEVFTAMFRAAGGGGLPRVVDACVGAPEEMAATWEAVGPDGRIAVIGDGWPVAGAPLVRRFGGRLQPVAAPLLSEVLAREASARSSEAIAPAAVRPAYVRRPDAVITRLQAGLTVSGDV